MTAKMEAKIVDNHLDKSKGDISVTFIHPSNGWTIETSINPVLLDRVTVDEIISELTKVDFIDGTNRFIKYGLIIDDDERYIEGNQLLGQNSLKDKSVVRIVEGCIGCG